MPGFWFVSALAMFQARKHESLVQMLFSLLVCYLPWWDSKSARCCHLHPSQTQYTRALRWICLNLFHKVTFPRKTKRCFNFRKSDSTEQPPVTKSSRKKGEGCTRLPLLTVSLQGDSLLSSLISTNSPISWDAATSAQMSSPQNSFGHHSWGPGLQVLAALSLLPSILPLCSPRAAPLCSLGRNGHPLPYTWLPPPLPMKETAFNITEN